MVRSVDVEWLTVNDVGRECLILVLVLQSTGNWEPCTADSDALLVPVCSGSFWDVEPVQFLVQQV